MNKLNYNVVLVPENEYEALEPIIDDYANMALDAKDVDELKNLFMMFFNELNLKVEQDFIVELVQHHIERLKEINEEKDGYR